LTIVSPTTLGQTTISGTPTASASGTAVSVTVKDANGATQTANYTLTISGPLSLVPATNTALPVGTVGTAYTTGTTIAASGGTPAYTYALTSGTLPNGLGLNTSTGAITGTPGPNTNGSYTIAVSVTDKGPTTVGPYTYTLQINPAITVTSSLGSATLPNGTTGVPYPTNSAPNSITFSATGGSGSYTWAISGLPGVGLSSTTGSTVTLTGSPNTPSTGTGDTVTITATDGTTTDVNYTLVTGSLQYTKVVIAAGVSITSPATGAAFPGATVGIAYPATGISSSISTTGGNGPYTWALASGSNPLPTGLNLTATGTNGATGLISGTPTGTPGASSFTVQVTDNSGSVATMPYTLTVYAAPTLTGPATLPIATVASAYTTAATTPIFTLTGGAPAVKWTQTGLPTGLSINSTSGIITGTPATGTNSTTPYTVKVTVTDANGATSSASPTLTVNAAIAVSPTTLPLGIPGAAYTKTTFTATGGGGSPYTFSATGLTGTGLTLSSAGVLSGTPLSTANSSNKVTLTVTDSIGTVATFPYTLTLAPPLSISGPASLPGGTVNVAYSSTTVTATGGTAPYTFTASGLPPGLTISSAGVISGTPTAVAGSPYTAVVTVKDANGTPATASFTIAISALPLQIITGLLPPGVINAPYPFTSIVAQGGVGGYTWSITGLPAGLTTDGNGNITGTPTTTTGSPFSVVVKVTDTSLTTVSRTYSLTISGVLTVVVPTTLPAATLNAAYTPVTSTAGGGLPPYTWTAVGLPAGMTINIATGVISGTPTSAAGSPYSVVVTVQDSTGAKASMTYTLAVASPLTISGPASLPSGTIGAAYPGTTVTATGGSGVYTWSATGLPSGLAISSSSGAISGTPAANTAGTDTVVVTVTDSNSTQVTKSYQLIINPGASSVPVISSVSASTEGQSLIAPNTWVSVYGSNFQPANFTDTWTNLIKASSTGALPTVLDGLSVMVGGQAAYVAYVSATQINVLTPNIGFGPLQVTVTNTAGTSNAVTITSQQDVPGFFEWPNNQPVATHQDYSDAVANGTFAGVTDVPAAPGETIILWGSGFGPTSPTNPFGVAIPTTPTYQTTGNVTVTINGAPATVYQSLAFLTAGNAGLFQLGVTVPASLPNGTYPLIVSINSVTSPTLTLTVQAH
jgi:uncharacterized protein (TIGR03437 family)